MPLWVVLVLLSLFALGLGTTFPISVVSIQNSVHRSQVGTITGARARHGAGGDGGVGAAGYSGHDLGVPAKITVQELPATFAIGQLCSDAKASPYRIVTH